MTEPVLHHVTLASGDVARSGRAEAAADVIGSLRPFIAGLIEAGPWTPRTEPIPTHPACFLQAITMHGRDAPLFRVYAGPAPPIPPEDAEALPLASFGVALNAGDGAAALWRSLHGLAGSLPAVTDAEAAPDVFPWCAVAIHPGLLSRPEAVAWLGGFERCVAWVVADLAGEGGAR